jgi:class 3 adenylate cyclase
MGASIDFSGLTLTEMIRLREALSEDIRRRFERRTAVAFSDVVGSTTYFARFGDNAGRALQQRHLDLLAIGLAEAEGRIVDTAGDGAFLRFPTVDQAIVALAAHQTRIVQSNETRAPEHHLEVRVGVHFGPVLMDETIVSGDAVNLCARVTGTADASSIRLTKAAFSELSSGRRPRCRVLGAVPLKGIADPVELLEYEWRDTVHFPTAVFVEETKARYRLPQRDRITFGRLPEHDGVRANDIILTHPDATILARLSRWHFELHRRQDGYYLKPVSEQQKTEVDGVPVPRGESALIRPGSRVRVGGVLTLVFTVEENPSLALTTVLGA